MRLISDIGGVATAVVFVVPLLWYAIDTANQRQNVQVVTVHHSSGNSDALTQTLPTMTTVRDPGIFAAQPGTNALDVSGQVRISGGNLVIENGDIIVGGRSIMSMLAAIVAQGQAACESIACVNGVHDFLRTCQCICDPGWSGQACDVFDCFNHGAWNLALQRCDCDAPYESSTQCRYRLCRGVMASTCEPLLETGCDVQGAFPADECTEQCGAPRSCAFRFNWGRSFEPTPEYMVGICPPYYSPDGNFVAVGAMECNPGLNSTQCAALFNLEAAFCCTYDSGCDGPSCTTSSCCQARTDRSSCLGSGCAWASNRVCADPNVIDTSLDCELPAHVNVSGRWSSFVTNCNSTTCPSTAVDRHVDILLSECGKQGPFNQTSDAACLETVRTRIDHESWPELVSGPVSALSTVRFDTQNKSLGRCRQRGSMFSNLCIVARHDALRFTFLPGTPANLLTPWQESHASGFLVTKSDGLLSCVASSELPYLLQLQIFDTAGVYLVPASSSWCGVFVLPREGILYDEAGVSVLGGTNLLRWQENDPLLLSMELM